MRTLRSLVAALAAATAVSCLAGVSLARAEDPKVPVEKYVSAAFKYRRDGSFDAAAAFIDEAIKNLPEKSEDRKVLALEGHELALVQGKFEKAARLIRGHDLSKELTSLARAQGRGELALKLARDSRDALVEGRVLRVLGRDQEALAALGKAGAAGAVDRGELLLKLERPADAARAFEEAGDVFRRAQALEKAKDSASTTTFDAAKVVEKPRLESLLAKVKEAKGRFDAASDPVAKDRTRFALAEAYERLVESYERYSIIHEKTSDRTSAAKLAELTVQFAQKQRGLVTDGGADKYGAALARWKNLDERDRRLEERARALK